MGRALLVLETPADRGKAVHWITKAPVGTRVEFKASKRSLPQNDLMWALLTDFSQQFAHNGKKYDPSEWKCIFLHAFGREISFLPSLDGRTFLPIEMSSSDLSKQEMTDFIEFILKEAAERGVILHIPKETTEPGSSSSEPVTDEATPPPSSAEPADSAPLSAGSSIPDAPNGGPAPGKLAGGDVSSSPSSPARDPETETLIQFAKDVLTTAAAEGSSLDAVKAIEKEYAAHIRLLSASGISRARSISSSARAILEGSTGLESAVEFFAERLGCDPEEIGG
jgi:hypothetical protein